ncbi:hypothetical protein TNCV_4197911 [Trichonephila clavipes]|nr:hypothetical protein TNCV_4197911 [Trichonephila clavipes]
MLLAKLSHSKHLPRQSKASKFSLSICHSHSCLAAAETLQSRVSVSPPLSTGTSDLLQVFVGTTSCTPDY